MKKLLSIIAATLFASTLCFAEIEHDYRFFEIGVDVTANVSENVLSVPDIFVKNLVIDFTKIADGMGSEGFIVDADGNGKFFINTKIGKNSRFGLFFDADVSARLGLSKEIFDFLGYGNELDTPVVTDLNVNAQAYAEFGFSVRTKIRNFTFKVKPSYYLPILYLPQPKNATCTVETQSDGNITADVDATFDLYSAFDLSKVFDSSLNFLGVDSILSSLSSSDSIIKTLQQGGFDLTATLEYPIFRTFDVGAYARIPIVPAKLTHSATGSGFYSAKVKPVLDSYSSGESLSYTTEGPTFTDVIFGNDSYSVNRPLRFGLEGAWKPFGSWCTFFPSIGFAANNPFGDDFNLKTSLYPEYSLAADIRIAYVLGLNLSTAYKQQIFIQKVGLIFNARIFELDVNVASSSANFTKSWLVSGLQANVGVRVGF